MNILAIDFGTKRIGLAWADTTLGVVLPYGLIEQESMAKKVSELVALLKKEHIDQIIIGFPLNLKGGENKNTERIKRFVFDLQKETTIPVEYVDERFSSFGADSIGDGVSRDERSAMFILEGYLDKRKRHDTHKTIQK
jgi:putative Holliday junction resolvase